MTSDKLIKKLTYYNKVIYEERVASGDIITTLQLN